MSLLRKGSAHAGHGKKQRKQRQYSPAGLTAADADLDSQQSDASSEEGGSAGEMLPLMDVVMLRELPLMDVVMLSGLEDVLRSSRSWCDRCWCWC